MNFQLLSRVIDELSQSITGARVERIYEGSGRALYLMLRRDRRHFYLLLSPDRSLPRLHLATNKPAASEAPQGFSLYLRSHAGGAVISRVALLNQDRIAVIHFSKREKEYMLLFELFGSSANIIMTDSALNILAVYYPTALADSVKRPLAPGIRYMPPDRHPVEHSPSDAAIAGGISDTKRDAAVSANEEAENFFERLLRERSFERLRLQLRAVVKKSLGKTERRIEALSRDLDASGQAQEYKKTGDLILANLGLVERGREQAELRDYNGEIVVLRLDPRRSATGNAELYFKKYKKAKAGKAIIERRLSLATDEADRLRSYQDALEQADGADALDRIQTDLVAAGHLPGAGKGKNRHSRAAAPVPFRKIEYLGWEILVGRNAAGNDYLTSKMARPRDLWLHAEGLPGSHVLVRNPAGGDIPPAVLSRAASLAAFYSKGKAAGKVAVTYTLAGEVSKPKGAKPGLVTLRTRKTIMVAPDGG